MISPPLGDSFLLTKIAIFPEMAGVWLQEFRSFCTPNSETKKSVLILRTLFFHSCQNTLESLMLSDDFAIKKAYLNGEPSLFLSDPVESLDHE
jgi:hypothetical protein